jgi:hypothetical protein
VPVRKIPKNYRSVTGAFASLKNGRNVFHESLLERDFFLMQEFDNSVESYEEQPIEIYYTYNGKKIKYTPDCLVHYNDSRKPCIYEVKFSNEIKEKKVFLQQKFEQIEEYLNDNDMDFKLFTEMDVDSIYLDNLKFLYNFSVIRNQTKIDSIKKVFLKNTQITYQDFLNTYSSNRYEQAEVIPYIWYLVLTNFLSIDLYKKICNDTILKVVK